MAKTKLDNKQPVTDGTKQMILKVDSTTHHWIKTIAEQTDTTQPNVVNLILSEAIKNEPTEYINRIKKVNAKQELQKIEEEIKTKEAERKRLTEVLKN